MARLADEELEELQTPDNWEDAEDAVQPPVKAPRAVVSIAFSREDFQMVADYAKRHGMKTSEYIREAALKQDHLNGDRVVGN